MSQSIRNAVLALATAAASAWPAVAGHDPNAPNLVFAPLTPCRVVDTRLTVAGKIAANETRTFLFRGVTTDYSSQGGIATGCGVPDLSGGDPQSNLAKAVAINIIAVEVVGEGDMRVFPSNKPEPLASSINYFDLTASVGIIQDNFANGIIMPMCDESATNPCQTGDISFKVDGSAAHLVVDVVGYFHEQAAQGGAGFTKANMYQNASAAIQIPAGTTVEAFVQCNDANDLPLEGTCMPANSGDQVVIAGEQALDWDNPNNTSGFRCFFKNEDSVQHTAQAKIVCINVP